MMRLAMGALSPAGPRAKLSILIFHRVVPQPDELFPGEVDAQGFDRICGWLAAWCNVLPLDEAAGRLRAGTLPSRSLVITFDDGYRDNHDVALPILRRHGLPATFFVATGFLDGGRMWNDTVIEALRRAPAGELDLNDIAGCGRPVLGTPASRRAAVDAVLSRVKYLEPVPRQAAVQAIAARAGVPLPDDLMMSSDQVRSLHRAGMQIGGHTVFHPILRSLDDGAARREIDEGRRHLQDITAAPVTLFAYPNGKLGQDYGPRDVELVRDCGFATAVTTNPGVSVANSDALQLPRYTPWKRSALGFGLQLAGALNKA